jgi:hypothetical protein
VISSSSRSRVGDFELSTEPQSARWEKEEEMDGEQEARWLAAQGVAVGADMVAAALRQLEFLAAVDRRRWLYEGPLLERAIHRYGG